MFDPAKIEGPFQMLNQRGLPYKTRCAINHNDLGMMEIKHSYEKTKELLSRTTVLGFSRRRF